VNPKIFVHKKSLQSYEKFLTFANYSCEKLIFFCECPKFLTKYALTSDVFGFFAEILNYFSEKFAFLKIFQYLSTNFIKLRAYEKVHL